MLSGIKNTSYKLLLTGKKIRCLLPSDAGCWSPTRYLLATACAAAAYCLLPTCLWVAICRWTLGGWIKARGCWTASGFWTARGRLKTSCCWAARGRWTATSCWAVSGCCSCKGKSCFQLSFILLFWTNEG